MVKQKSMNTWKPVKLEGAITAESVEGLIGIEELSDYDLSSVLKTSKTQSKKRKLSNSEPTEVKKSKKKQDRLEVKKKPDKVDANRKQELNNSSSEPGAFVRNPNSPAKKEKQPKTDTNKKLKAELKKQSKIDTNKERQSNNQSNNDTKQEKSKQKKKVKKAKKDVMKKEKDKTKKTDGVSNKITKKRKVEIGEIAENTDGDKEKYSVADLAAWSNLPLPEPLLQALADMGFTKPTQIQELTLAPAILGRRDILGAAETGSGKTLAFGLPILTGILNLKEKAKKEASKTANEEQQDVGDDSEDDAVASDDETSTEDGNEENDQDEDDFEDDSDMEDDDVETNDDENEINVDNEDEDSEESDFEENEEEIENANENGIGCIRSINNIDLNESITAEPRKPLYGLILTPTRELAVQVKNHLIALAKHTDIRIAVVLGGMAAVKQERFLSKGPEVVVATPGRLWELIQQGNPHLSQVDNIRYLAIDETDRMIEKYHFQELHHLLERLNMDETKRITRQNFVFSATLTMVHDLPRHLLKKKKMKAKKSSKITKMTAAQKLEQIIEMLGINNPKIVDVTQQSGTAKLLTECRINCAIEEKDYYVYYFLLRHPGRTLVFCNSIGCVKRLATLLSLLGCSSLPLHASMQQRQRLKNLERFRDDPLGVLVATDVAARGLDIPKVEHVLHYQTPRTSESYIHRSGRTARASEEGITVMLIEPNEVGDYVKVCRTLGRSEDIPVFPVYEKMLVAVRQRVNVARQLDKLELQARRTNSECGWLQKAANDMDIILDEDEFAVNKNEKEAANLKRHISAIRKQLSTNLVKPIMPRGFSARYPTSSGELNIPLVQGDQSTKKALDVMKTAMEDGRKMKKKPRKLFKAKDRINAANKAEKINGKKLNVTNKKKNNVMNKANKNKRKQKRKK